MNYKTNWIEILFDYFKRYPNVKLKSFGLDFHDESLNIKLKHLKVHSHDKDVIIARTNDCYDLIIFKQQSGGLSYGNINHMWTKVPEHILLRLLTEGKEDLL